MKSYRLNPLDILLLLLLSAFFLWFIHRLDIGIHYQWNWSKAITLLFTPQNDGALPYFFQGLIATIRLSVWGILFALVLGGMLAIIRFENLPILNSIAFTFIQIMRNVPPLVFIFLFYFFISSQLIPLFNLDALLRDHQGDLALWQQVLFGPASLWENLLSGVLCIGILSASYIAEVIRSGLNAIPKGQWEAAYTLDLGKTTTYRRIIFPQTMTLISPALAGQFIALIKDTSIVSLISIQEMTFVGGEIANSSGLIFEIWLIVGLSYFILCYSVSRIFRWLENT